MGMSIKGYVLEPPRIGAANSPYTQTPSITILDQAAFDTRFPTGDEPKPRVEYFVTVLPFEATIIDGVLKQDVFLHEAKFAWAKNEGTVARPFNRFGYDNRTQSFKLLPGSTVAVLGQVTPALNTARVKIPVPIELFYEAPFRLSCVTPLGGAGTPLTLYAVDTFGSPGPGSVEYLRSTGELNWNPADFITYQDQLIRFQQQNFFQLDQSTGFIGSALDAATPGLLLNPLPATGQFPMVRIGFRTWYTPIEKPNDADLLSAPDPDPYTFYWSNDTGLLRFNAGQLSQWNTDDIYYDGVFLGYDLQLPRENIIVNGTKQPMTSPYPQEGCELMFVNPDDDYRRYSTTDWVDDFSFLIGWSTVEVKRGTYQIEPGGLNPSNLIMVRGDLPIEYGVGMRFFRNVVNLTADPDKPGDLSVYWSSSGDNRALLASPLTGSPFVSLPSVPLQNFTQVVKIEPPNGLGELTLEDLSYSNANPAWGYFIDYPNKQMQLAKRVVDEVQVIPLTTAQLLLPSPLVLGRDYSFSLTDIGGNYQGLVENQDYLLNKSSGLVTFTTTQGELVASGSLGSFAPGSGSGAVFKDTTSSYVAQFGDVLVIPSGANEGVFRLQIGSLSQGIPTDIPASTPITATNLTYQIYNSPEVVADRYWEPVTFPDPVTKIEKIRLLGPIQNETVLVAGILGLGALTGVCPTPQTLVDNTIDFLTTGVKAGDTIQFVTGTDAGSYRVINTVDQHEVSFAPAIQEVNDPYMTYKIVRRLNLEVIDLANTRFRFGSNTFVSNITSVATDADFDPSLLTKQVQVSLDTGNLNFSPVDLPTGQNVYWVYKLQPGTDYKLQPNLGFIDFKSRFLQGEEALATYKPLVNGQVGEVTRERISFSILKEQTADRTEQTDTVYFNPAGRTVAALPEPQVFRGGRPQNRYFLQIDVEESRLTFLPGAGYLSDALPQGTPIWPDERILVDYYVYEAVGGEKSATLLNPVYVADVKLLEDADEFTLEGDQRAKLPVGTIFKVESNDIYSVGSITYPAPGTVDVTQVRLSTGQYFESNYTNPAMWVVSGETASTVFREGTFVYERNPRRSIPRGSNEFKVYTDVTSRYQAGTLVFFENKHYYLVVGSKFSNGWTEVTLSSNTKTQYSTEVTLQYSKKVIWEDNTKQFQTSYAPIKTLPFEVYRRVAGKPGQIVRTDYSLDTSGSLKLQTPLTHNEELLLRYTGNSTVPGVRNFKYTYTHGLVPNSDSSEKPNGFIGSNLTMEYTTWSADTFYYRVETLTKFSSEVSQYFQAQALSNSPGSGPRTSNAPGSPGLAGSGRESVYYPEIHIANMDLVARKYLKYLNDAINHLEDTLRSFDGRVIGGPSGRFKFDGKIDNPVRPSTLNFTNDVDDRIQTGIKDNWFSDDEPIIQPGWQAHKYSRLYPEYKSSLYGKTTAGEDTPDIQDGVTIMQLNGRNLTSWSDRLEKRVPRTLVVKDADIGATKVYVQENGEQVNFSSPGFTVGMMAMLQTRDYALIPNADGTVFTVLAVLSDTEGKYIQFDKATTVKVPRGSTVTLHPGDTFYQVEYSANDSVTVEPTSGQLLYYDTWWPGVEIPKSNTYLELYGVGIVNTLTAPFRFPALDGLAISDTFDTGIPIATQTYDCEVPYLQDELDAIEAYRLVVTGDDPKSGASYSVATNTITFATPYASGKPAPQVYDLIRFLDGPLATEGWRKITAVVGQTLVLEPGYPFTTDCTNQEALFTAADDVTSGLCTAPTGSQIDSPSLVTAKVGQTVIFTDPAHPNGGKRRQISSKPSPTTALLYPPIFQTTTPFPFRVSNHLSTNQGWDSITPHTDNIIKVVLTNDQPAGGVDSEVLGIQRFLLGSTTTDGILTVLVYNTINIPAAPNLTDFTKDFTTVPVGSFVYVESGANQGVYGVTAVTPHILTLDTPFPATSPNTLYRVVKAYGLTKTGFQALVTVKKGCEDWAQAATDWKTKLALTAPFVGSDAAYYVNDLRTTDFEDRQDALEVRQQDLANASTGPIAQVAQTLGTRDSFYNKRYLWLDGRANIERGLLYLQSRSKAVRIKNLEQQKNDLERLASME